MGLTVSWGFTNSEDTKTLTIPDLNWDANYAAVSKTAEQSIVTNTTSPLDQPESIRVASQKVNNIYNGTGIDPAYFAVSKAGVQAHAQVRDIARVSNSDDPSFRVDLPVSCGITIRTPMTDYLSANDILSVVLRAVASLFDDDSVTSDRLKQMLRGGTTPGTL